VFLSRIEEANIIVFIISYKSSLNIDFSVSMLVTSPCPESTSKELAINHWSVSFVDLAFALKD